jgi:anti-anti-sigma factor
MPVTDPFAFVPAPFSVELASRDGAVVLVVRGELDLLTAEDLERALLTADAAGAPASFVDLTALEFMDLSGLDALLDAAERSRAQGRRLAVRIGTGRGRRLFELLDVTAALQVLDDGAAEAAGAGL